MEMWVFGIILGHWLGDFFIQDEKWTTTKSKSFKSLLKHTVTYSLFWFLVLFFWMVLGYSRGTFLDVVLFTLITFLAHTITDFFTSRWASKLYQKNKLGSLVIWFGHILHYIQLYLTFYFIFIV